MQIESTEEAPDALHLAPTRLRSILLIGALFTFFFAAYAFTASADFFSTGDTTIRVQTAENILFKGTPQLVGWRLQYPAHIKKEFIDPRIDIGRNGGVYPTYLLGQPLAIIPFDFFASHLAIHERWPYGATIDLFDRNVGPLFGALEALVFFLFGLRLGYGRLKALLLTLIFGFATMAWPDEQSVLEHTEVAFFLLLAMYFAFRYRNQDAGWKYLLFTGFGIGGAAITRYQDAFLGLIGVGVYLLWPRDGSWRLSSYPYVERARELILLGLGILPFALLDLWYSWFRFGTPFASGHHETVFGYAIWKGALGLTVSPGKGLLWFSPTIFLLALAMPRFTRRFSALSAGIGALTLSFILLYGYVTYWHGDPAWGPRYIYPLVPFLTLPLGELLRWKGSLRRAVYGLTAGVVMLGFLIQFSAISVSPWRTWYRVIAYEEARGHTWNWIAARYRYHWNLAESPILFQVHGLYQMAYDGLLQSNRYDLVPPDEDPILDNMTTTYAVNQWNFWWKSNEFDWWMGEQKIEAVAAFMVALMLASGVYLAAEAGGVFSESGRQRRLELATEAA